MLPQIDKKRGRAEPTTLFVIDVVVEYKPPVDWIGWTNGTKVPTITIHGVTQEAVPSSVVVHGFLQYFYCDNPPHSIQTFVTDINARIGYTAVVAAEVVMKRSIFGHNENVLPYLKVM